MVRSVLTISVLASVLALGCAAQQEAGAGSALSQADIQRVESAAMRAEEAAKRAEVAAEKAEVIFHKGLQK